VVVAMELVLMALAQNPVLLVEVEVGDKPAAVFLVVLVVHKTTIFLLF
jgi:hypothetical protein